MLYAEFKLTVARRDTSYAASVSYTSPGGAHQTQLVAYRPVDLNHTAQQLLYEFTNQGTLYGHQLRDVVFADPDLVRAWDRACVSASALNAAIRVQIDLDPSDEPLNALSWETLFAPGDDMPIALHEHTPLSRAVTSLDFIPPASSAPNNLHAAVVIANPDDLDRYNLSPIDTLAELRLAQDALGESVHAVVARGAVASIGQATLSNIAAALREAPQILYLVCHGRILANGEGVLYLESDEGTTTPTTAHAFVQAIRALC